MKTTTRSPRLVFAWIGRPGDSSVEAPIADYVERIRRFHPTEIRWLRPAGGDGPAAIRDETNQLSAASEKGGAVWLFDRAGKRVDSIEFARWLGEDLDAKPAPILFLVGGAGGIDRSRLPRVDRAVSLSDLTFPHALARLLAVEQVFRALTLRKGISYHK